VDENVNRNRQERNRQRQARDDRRQQELGREQPQHDRRVASAQAERDERGDRVQGHADREQELDPLAAGQRQWAQSGAREIGERERAER
jgi:hypothetical protein